MHHSKMHRTTYLVVLQALALMAFLQPTLLNARAASIGGIDLGDLTDYFPCSILQENTQ